jgi:hypothetical protein
MSWLKWGQQVVFKKGGRTELVMAVNLPRTAI